MPLPNQIQVKVLDHLQVALIRTRNAPLANAMEALVMGGTYRDEPDEVAMDLAVAIAAQDPTNAVNQTVSLMGAVMGGATVHDKACSITNDIGTAAA
jgi:hypothetical protein